MNRSGFKNAGPSFWSLAILTFTLFVSPTFAQQAKPDTSLTPVGATKIWGKIDGVSIEGAVEGPSIEATPLQIACVFEYTEGDIFNSPPALPEMLNGMVHLDKALNGIITDIRKSGKFTGHRFETILISPPPGKISPKKLLLIGLGDRNQFTAGLMRDIAVVAIREALRMGVTSFSFASDLKDAGVDSPTALVAKNEVTGMFDAYRAELFLKQKNMSSFQPLTKITLLAGPSFFTVAGQGISDAIATFK